MPRTTSLEVPLATNLRPVVLVDDSPDDRFLSSRMLRRAGLRNPIVTLSDGDEAIAYLRSTCLAAGGERRARPQLMFLDIKMPRCDGFRVLRWLRRRKAFRKLDVIMLTHSDEPVDVAAALKLGARDVVMKFPSPATLTKLLPVQLVSPPAAAERPKPGREGGQ